MRRAAVIDSTLGSLAALDLVLSVWGFAFPEAWYAFFHGAAYVDPQGLLPRCAANWLAFFLIQAVALGRWRRTPGLLLVVAGCRLGDMLTDITCLVFASNVTVFGAIAFPIAGLGNVALGTALIRLHHAHTS